jgi:pimeloyl-ACP methyl ester carboxylesterase
MSNLVLIPGFMCNNLIWQYQPKKLSAQFNIITPDLIKGETIIEYSDNIAKTLPDNSSVLGFSMGGFVALRLAIDYPSKVKKLILVGTNARSVSNERKDLLTRSLKILNKRNYIKKFTENNIKSYVASQNLKNKFYLDILNSMTKSLGLECLKKQTNAIVNRFSLIDSLSKIKSKTLIISGEVDKLSSRDMNEELKRNINTSKYFNIKNSGHFVMLEEAKVFYSEVLNWL